MVVYSGFGSCINVKSITDLRFWLKTCLLCAQVEVKPRSALLNMTSYSGAKAMHQRNYAYAYTVKLNM